MRGVRGCCRTKQIQHTKSTGHNLYNAKDSLVRGSRYSNIWQRDFDLLLQRFPSLNFFLFFIFGICCWSNTLAKGTRLDSPVDSLAPIGTRTLFGDLCNREVSTIPRTENNLTNYKMTSSHLCLDNVNLPRVKTWLEFSTSLVLLTAWQSSLLCRSTINIL